MPRGASLSGSRSIFSLNKNIKEILFLKTSKLINKIPVNLYFSACREFKFLFLVKDSESDCIYHFPNDLGKKLNSVCFKSIILVFTFSD